MEASATPFRVGDRVEWIGPPGDSPDDPHPGERGWVLDLNPMDDVVAWDEAATIATRLTDEPNIVLVGDRNEPDAMKRLPHDPDGTNSRT
jgi:hypothetical protein